MAENLQSRFIHSLALSTSKCCKNLFKNIKDEFIIKIFKGNHLQANEKNIGDFVVDLQNNNQGRPSKTSVRQKRNISYLTTN